MQAILFALVSYIGWGSGDIPTVYASRKAGPYVTAFWTWLIGLILSSLYVPFALNDISKISFEIVVLDLLLGSLLGSCWIAYNKAMKIGKASIVGTIAGSFSFVVVILSIVFLREKVSIIQLGSIIIITLGLMLALVNRKELISGKVFTEKGSLIALFIMLGWGIYFAFIKISVEQIGWFWSAYIPSISGLLAILVYGLKKSEKFTFNNKFKNGLAMVVASILTTTGSFTYNFAISVGAASIVAPIAGSYPTLFVFLAFLIFKDRIAKQQLFGIVITLVGIVLLAFLSR